MATESTSLLSKEQTDQLKATGDSIKNTAVDLGAKTQATAADVSAKLVGGKYNLSILGFVGGLLMLITNFKEIFGDILSLKIGDAITDLYLMGFGLLIALVNSAECKDNMNFAPKSRQLVLYYAKFLCATWGRGFLYVFVGTIALSQWTLTGLIGSSYMFLLGFVCILIGGKTARKLSKLRDNEKEVCMRKFNKLATHGVLDVTAYAEFLDSFDLDLGMGEIVASFTMLDSDCDGFISVEEFDTWWDACEKLEASDEEEPEDTPTPEEDKA